MKKLWTGICEVIANVLVVVLIALVVIGPIVTIGLTIYDNTGERVELRKAKEAKEAALCRDQVVVAVGGCCGRNGCCKVQLNDGQFRHMRLPIVGEKCRRECE